MKKRAMVMAVAAMMAAGALTACGGGSKDTAGTADTKAAEETKAEEKSEETGAEASGEKQVFPAGTVTVYAMGNPQYRQQWFETWLDNHRDIAPDVKIEFVQTKGTADIREKITMTALSGATDDLPDAAMLDPVTIQDLAKAGLLKDETEYLTPLIDKMVDGATTDATISGHIYALPDSVRPQVLFYNKAIFDEYGIDPEMMKTMDGYIEAGRQLKEKSNGEVYLSYIDPTSKTWRYWGRRGLMPSAGATRPYAEKNGAFIQGVLTTFSEADALTRSQREQSIALLAKTMGLPAPVIASYLDHRPPTTIKPLSAEVAALQQQTADLFYENRLVPKKVDIRQRIWQPTQLEGKQL